MKRTANKIGDIPLFIVQGFRPICPTGQIKGFLALFPEVKKVRRSRAPRGRSELGCAVELMETMSLAGLEHGGQGDRHGCGSSLVAESLPGAFFSGAACQPWRLSEEFPLPRACLAALFALGKTDTPTLPLYLSAYSGVWVLPVEYSVLDFSGHPACTSLGSTVDTCSSRALEEFTYFLRCRELES